VTLQLVVVTGLSGAGRSTAAHCLEDLGWFVVDNLPPSLLSTMVDLALGSEGAIHRSMIMAMAAAAATGGIQSVDHPRLGPMGVAASMMAARR